MGDVIDLDLHREDPHIVIDCTEIGGSVHVYPVSFFVDVVQGTESPHDIEPEVLGKILHEWLRGLGVEALE